MPALFVFLFKVNIALLLFCAGYYLVLRHLTFYSLNRVYLITAIVFASIYPRIDLTAFAQRHENIAVPVQTVLLNWQVPAAKLVKPFAQPDYWTWATALFWAGAAVLAIRLFVQLFSLLKLYSNSKPAKILNHDVRLMSGKAAPFSFWRSIYVNPENHTTADLKAILLHEQVHVNGWHTVDILLAELSSIFYWFNPGVWLIKKAVRENIEFITDRKILNQGIDTKAYQYSLVNVSFNATTPGIVNHFNISTIKKRIIMMNAKRSSRFNLTRYAFILPAIALLLVFSFSNAAIVKKGAKVYKAISRTISVNLKDAMPVTLKKTIRGDSNVKSTDFGKSDAPDPIYYVNGLKQVTGTEAFTNETESVYYMNPADAKKYFNAGDGKHQVAFVTTKNSVEGKTFQNQIERLVAENKIAAGRLNHITVSSTNNIGDGKTSLTLKSDTSRKTSFTITTNSLQSLDSLNYVLNGKKITSADFKKIDPNTIASVNITSVDQAKLVLDDFESFNFKKGSKILFVNTNDSPKGKQIASSLGIRNRITAIRINGKTSTLAENFSPAQIDSLTTKRNGRVVKFQTLTQLNTVKGFNSAQHGVDSVIILREGVDLSKTPKLKEVEVKTMTFNVSPDHNNMLNNVTVSDLRKVDGSMARVRSLSANVFYDSNTVNRISDKLIIIDGKEATEKELKKLSAFEIDRMSTSSDADTVKKYGSKAKYGVVYIYTKKAK